MADNILPSTLNANGFNGIAPGPLSMLGLNHVAPDPRREYVSGNPYGGAWAWPWLQRLPLPDDDLETLLGNDVYARMMNDPQVFSSTMLLITLVMRRGLRLDVPFPDADEESPKFQRAVDIMQFCERALNNLDTPIDTVLFEMLQNAMPYGSSIAEKTFELGSGHDRNHLLYKSIKVKPRQVYSFVVDPYWNFVGLATWAGPPNDWLDVMADTIGSQSFISTATLNGGNWLLIDRSKFAHLAILTKNNDPRGNSWLRPAYNSWYEKMKLWPELDLFWQRFAGPGLVGNTAENAAAQYPLDDTGAPDTTQPKVTAEEALLQAMLGYHNSDAVALPFGAKMAVIQNSNDGSSFQAGIDLCDGQINKAITFQALANTSGKVMSRNASEVHQDVLWNPVLYLRGLLGDMMTRDILEPLVVLNFGEGARTFTPRPDFGRVAPEDLARNMSLLGDAVTKGAAHWTQMPYLWRDFDMPMPDFEIWIAEIMAEKALLLQTGQVANASAAAAGAPAATQPTGAPASAPAGQGAADPLAAPPLATGDEQSQANKFAVQELGKATTRAMSRRIAGKMGHGF